ncbi:unnamed protein product [Medioppia subpectinata]|uniref:E2 NEDD8-conjugating enzyme n=1 Tax=Medioppia subpectinata TaxID=1979941 RepID=A0A7R9L0E7_9ACAR|nr:unnamed protein product [Medioppia subpectinata]CAG2112983.1 unnamed protein product [Medioppia subpectinata]
MIVMEKPLLNSDNSEETSTDLHRNKDSLDRFDDSLCVLLLPYLPFKDLIRLECVSKQFQTVTKSALTDHKTLVIDDDLMGPKGCAIHVNRLMNEIKRLCPHIERIDVHGYKRQNKIIGQLNSTNFPRLTQVYCDFSKLCNIGAQLWIELGQYITGVEFYRIEEAFFRPIDPKMAAMRVINKRRDLLKYFKNISFMRVRNLEQVFDKTTGKLSFNSLKGFEIIFNEVAHLKLWSEFVKGNNSLKYPPHVKCLTRIWHPNISEEGDICLSLLRESSIDAMGWAPTRTLKDVVWGLNSLFTDLLNFDDPLNDKAADHYLRDRESFQLKVRDYVHKYAKS